MDARYHRGKIYTIRCRYDDSKIYVGSTINDLSRRMTGHRCLSLRKSFKLYQEVNGDWDNWYIELFENYPCNSKQELEKREGEVIRQIGTINKVIPGRTRQEFWQKYKKDNAEKIRVYKQSYYQNNKDEKKLEHQQYYADNIDKIRERHKEYAKSNHNKIRDRMTSKIICACGCELTKQSLFNHLRSSKHKQIMENKK